jgi:hypothetical protein
MSVTPPDDAIREAELIFNGTVEELGVTTVAAFEAAANTAAVLVVEVVRASRTLADIAGQRITVELQDPDSVTVGTQYTFYVVTLLFGESIAVREVAHHDVQAAEAMGPQVTAAVESAEDERLRERAREAELVVRGRVAQVRPSPAAAAEAAPAGPISEHEPQWWEAVIDVDEVVKGELDPAAPTVVLFPFSTDVMWVDAPKFHAGEEGVWMLRPERVPAAATEMFPSVYTALDPRDFQPAEQAERVARLVKETP